MITRGLLFGALAFAGCDVEEPPCRAQVIPLTGPLSAWEGANKCDYRATPTAVQGAIVCACPGVPVLMSPVVDVAMPVEATP